MNLELTLEEARNLIASKLGCDEKDVKIILPETETTKEVFKDLRNDFSDKGVRAVLVRDIKTILTTGENSRMFAIRYFRYRCLTLGLKDAKAFVEMSEVEFNTFIESGYLPDGRMLV